MNTVGLDYGEVESTVIAIAECANTGGIRMEVPAYGSV